MSATISACGRYRYRLERHVDADNARGPVFAFFGVNPSTADETNDDATVRKWIGFMNRWGGSRFIVGNVFAFRATDVRALRLAADPVGSVNRWHLEMIADDADVLVPCWGDRAKVPRELHAQIDQTLALLRATGKPVKHFGLTKGGDPKHPLMLGYDTPLVPYGVGLPSGETFPTDHQGVDASGFGEGVGRG